MPGDGGSPSDGGPFDGGSGDAGINPLGNECGAGLPACPAGHFCAAFKPNSTRGFCSKGCPAGNHTVCRAGYNGPGLPHCGPMLRDLATSNPRAGCSIACGTNFGGDGTCPNTLVCSDLYGPTMAPPADGDLDVCAEP